MKKGLLALAGIILIAAMAIYGCTTTSSTPVPHGTIDYLGTQSPGDVWTWELGEGTFAATNETLGFTYGGTFSTLPSGFLKGVVTLSTDPSVVADGSRVVYLLEYQDTMLMVKPGGTSDKVIACSALSATAPTSGQYNWVKMPIPGWDATINTAYGTADLTVSGSTFNCLLTKYHLDGSLKEVTTEAGFVLTGGRLVRPGDDLQFFLTPSGMFMGDGGSNSGGFVGIKNETVDVNDVASKNYRGVLYDYDGTTGKGYTTLVGAEPLTTGTLRGYMYTDVERNIIDTAHYVTLTFGPQDSSGVASGTMTKSDGTLKIFRMVIAKVGGKYIIAGIEAAFAHNPNNFIVIQQ